MKTVEQEIERLVRTAEGLEEYKKNLNRFSGFPDEIKDNEEIAKLAIKHNTYNIRDVSPRLRKDPKFNLFLLKEIKKDAAEKSNPDKWDMLDYDEAILRLEDIHKPLLENRNFALLVVKKFSPVFKYISEKLRGDKEIARLALENAGNFKHLPDELKNDPELLKEATYKNEWLYRHLPPELRDDEKLAEFVFRKSALNYKYFSERLKNNKEYAKKAVMQLSLLARSLPDNLKADRDFIMDLLNEKPALFGYLGPEFKDDYEIAFFMMIEDGNNIRQLSPRLRDLDDLAEMAIDTNLKNYQYLSPRLRSNEKLARKAIEKNPGLFSFLPENLRDNEDIVLPALKTRPNNIQHASDRFKDDVNLAEKILEDDPLTYTHFSERVKSSLLFAREAITKNETNFVRAPDTIKDNEEIANLAINKNSANFSYISERLKMKKDFIMEILVLNPAIIRNIPDNLKDDLEVVAVAVEANPEMLNYASKRIQKIFYDKPKHTPHKNPEGIEYSENTPSSLYNLVRLMKKGRIQKVTWKLIADQGLLEDKNISKLMREYSHLHVSPEIKRYIESLEIQDLTKAEKHDLIKKYRGELNSKMEIPVQFILDSKSYQGLPLDLKPPKKPEIKEVKQEIEEPGIIKPPVRILDVDDPEILRSVHQFRQSILNKGHVKHHTWSGPQRAFTEARNHVMMWIINVDDIPPKLINAFPSLEVNTHVSEHPFIKGNLTLGWVRYTLGKDITKNKDNEDIWVDEIQTDLSRTFGKENFEQVFPIDKINYLLMKKFIKFIRSKGFEKIYLPNVGMASTLYNRGPVFKSPYTTLPRKLRFKLEEIQDFHEKVNNEKVWVLAKKKYTNLDTGYNFKL